VERIGVFLDQSVEEIIRHVMQVNLTGVQLHGEESPLELWSYLPPDRRAGLRIIKTCIIQEGFEVRLKLAMNVASEVVDAWLLDSGAGSGKSFEWHAAKKQLAGRHGRFIIAGGLTPGNVGEAIGMFHPFGVDVVSGVESEPGRKDRNKLRAFVQAVREAENEKWAQ
jgi:phosphoribosylanthranilate isomerase